jgi:hypothetical protein
VCARAISLSIYFFFFFFFTSTTTMATTLVIPGQRLGRAHQYQAGEGTYVRNDIVHSAIVGKREIGALNDDEVITARSLFAYTHSLSLSLL